MHQLLTIRPVHGRIVTSAKVTEISRSRVHLGKESSCKTTILAVGTVMLSVAETCGYQNIEMLEFLLAQANSSSACQLSLQ